MRNFFAIIQYTLIYFSPCLPFPANPSWYTIHSPSTSYQVSLFRSKGVNYMLLFFPSTLLISANIMALGSIRVTNEEGFFEGGGVCFIFLCDGIVIFVYPFNICCSHLSFPQLTDVSYFSFLGKQQT